MAIGQVIDDLPARLDAIETALRAALEDPATPDRIVTRSLKSFAQREAADLKQGVVTLISAGEKEYRNDLGREASDGTQKIILIGHLQVDEDTEPQAIEAAEVALIEEIKGFCRAGVTGMSLELKEAQQSRQQEHPYGWVVAYIDVVPPRTNVY